MSEQPLRPSEQIDENYIEYCDPFDTSIVDTAKLPGHAELKFLEKELLSDIKIELENSLSDEEFDPRACEAKERSFSRPDVLHIASAKTVSFDLPSPTEDLLNQDNKTSKPLTPFYVRKNSVPEETVSEELDADPFDTSFVSNVAPGKAELKQIESELFDPATERNLGISDQNFDPRDETRVKIEQVVQSIKNISNPDKVIREFEKPKQVDLLAIDHEVATKVLTPFAEQSQSLEDIYYQDPFDTSIATNIQPGKTELKLLETELIHSVEQDQDFDPRQFNKRGSVDLLDDSGDIGIHCPLNPVINNISFDNSEDIDPFDTSIANNIVPGKTELKILESQLM